MQDTVDTPTYREIHFAVMAIESGARKLNIGGREMEQRLQKQDLIRRRLIGQYELLHTQSLEYDLFTLKDVINKQEWNEDTIEERAEWIASKVNEIWKK